MSDETKIEDEDTENVEAHGKLASRVASATGSAGDDDSDDVEAHGKLASRVVSANADEEGDDDVQAHAHRLTS